MVPVGAELIVFETEPRRGAAAAPRPRAGRARRPRRTGGARARAAATAPACRRARGARRRPPRSGRVATSPAIRRRAHEAGIDLRQVAGSGPNGRIVPKDLEAFVARRARAADAAARRAQGRCRAAAARRARRGATEEIKVIGLRRLIAQRMSEAKRNIPHFAYVEELDITELESLRRHLNGKLAGRRRRAHLPAVPGARAGARAARLPAVQCALRRRARRDRAPPRRALGRRDADPGRPEGAGGARCAGRCSLWELAARDAPRERGGAHQQGDARGAQRLDHHDHEPRQARRHRQHADHQRAGGGDHRRQPRRRAPAWCSTARSPSAAR